MPKEEADSTFDIPVLSQLMLHAHPAQPHRRASAGKRADHSRELCSEWSLHYLFPRRDSTMFLPVGDDVNKRTMPFAGLILIAVNVLVFLFELRVAYDSQPSGAAIEAFINRWGLVPVDFFDGYYVGLVSCMFLHGGFGHLIGNMMTLWLFTPTLEAALGSTRFLLFYLWWGVVAGLAQALVDPTSELPIIGASGAICGIIGAYFVTFGPLANVRCMFYGGFLTGFQWVKFKIPAGAYVFFWIIIPQMWGMGEAQETGSTDVAWYAHVGGFVAGMFALRFLAWDARQKLVSNREGQLQIGADDTQPGPLLDESGAALGSITIAACPYCDGPLSEQHKLESGLYRCPHDGCQRLVLIRRLPRKPANAC